ncbi:PKD domain-containing protein [Actinospica robiniae]|uniref:PKD domain-containing protein n=1 Tax=Actinospica robiniae TaxID=304901 RepID=UPI0012F9D7F1|nr:PKD domain-containing protein [Actinospica robiniae]
MLSGAGGDAVVAGGSNVTFTHDAFNLSTGATGPALHVTDSAAEVTVLDSRLMSSVVVDGGADGTVLTNDVLVATGPNNVSIVGASNTAVTGNTIGGCGQSVSVTGSAVGTSLENNIIDSTYNTCVAPPQSYGLLVDASSAPGTTSDYNDVYAGGSAAYDWAGAAYPTASALYAVTGQGQHDDNSLAGTVANEGSPAVNSADSAAVDEQPVDFNGDPRVLDPLVKPTGVGPYDYYDRGAVELQDPLMPATTKLIASATQAPVGGAVTLQPAETDTWSYPLTYEFEDNNEPLATTLGANGTYTASLSTLGDHTIWAIVVAPNGVALNASYVRTIINVVPAAPLVAKQKLSTSGDAHGVPLTETSVIASSVGSTDSWNLTGASFSFGDGTPAVPGIDNHDGTWSTAHTYAKAGTYKITETVTDAGGHTASTTSSFTTTAPPAGTLEIGTRSTGGTSQTPPWPTPAGLTGIAQAAITALPNGTAQLVAVTTSGVVELDIRNAAGTWQGWHALAQPGTTVKWVSIAGMRDDSTQIIEVTSTHKILQNIRKASGTWQAGWTNPTSSSGVAQAVITAMPDGTSQIAAVTTAGKLLYDIRYTNGTWRGWQTLAQSGITVKAAGIAGMPDGSTQFTEVTSTGLAKLLIRKANGSWATTTWTQIGSGAAQISSAALPNGTALCEIVTTSGAYESDVRNTNGTWQGWRAFALPGTVGTGSVAGQHNGTALIVAVAAG